MSSQPCTADAMPAQPSSSSPLAQFEAAVQVVDSLPRGSASQSVAMQGFKPSTELMLKFYALYKQATQGPCEQPRPAFWDLIGKMKWDAWRALGQMPREQAMLEYCAQLRSVIESLPNSSPAVSGLIDKVASFYRLVDNGEASSSDVKRGLLLANRIRSLSGCYLGNEGRHDRVDVNSNFLTQSLPPKANNKLWRPVNGFVSGGNNLAADFRSPARDSQADRPEHREDSRRRSSSSESDSEEDEFCDSYDNFVQPPFVDEDEDEDVDEDPGQRQPPGDVTGGQQQPSQSSTPSSSGGANSDGRRHGRQQHQHQQSSSFRPENGGFPWQQQQQQRQPPQPPAGQQPFNIGSATNFELERELVDQLRHIRASLDRLSGDLGQIHVRLDALERRSLASSLSTPSPVSSFRWFKNLFFNSRSNGGLSLPALLLLLAWPVLLQLLWRLPWRKLRRRGRLAL